MPLSTVIRGHAGEGSADCRSHLSQVIAVCPRHSLGEIGVDLHDPPNAANRAEVEPTASVLLTFVKFHLLQQGFQTGAVLGWSAASLGVRPSSAGSPWSAQVA
jgi:hypothetical protein